MDLKIEGVEEGRGR